MSNVSPDSVVEAWTSLIRTASSLLDAVETELKSAGFPPLAWYDVLWELDKSANGELPQSVIQSRVLLAQYNLCRLLSRLEAQKLVERRASTLDARSNTVALTDKGRELRSAMWPVYARALQENVGCRIDEKGSRMLVDLLDGLRPG